MAMTRNSATRVSFEKLSEKQAEIDKAQTDTQRFNFGDEHSGDVGTHDRTHAADDDNDEGIADNGEVHSEIGRFTGNLQGAA